MSLDATILEVRRINGDVLLVLGPRIESDESLSVTGQSLMRIEDATWQPEPGMDLWGDAGRVAIVKPNRQHVWYARIGYHRLRETR